MAGLVWPCLAVDANNKRLICPTAEHRETLMHFSDECVTLRNNFIHPHLFQVFYSFPCHVFTLSAVVCVNRSLISFALLPVNAEAGRILMVVCQWKIGLGLEKWGNVFQ